MPAKSKERKDKKSSYPYQNCLDCPEHEEIADPDPDDWFNDDDMAVVCTLTPNPEQNKSSRYAAERQEFRVITQASRPYQLRSESKTPSWCPLKK